VYDDANTGRKRKETNAMAFFEKITASLAVGAALLLVILALPGHALDLYKVEGRDAVLLCDPGLVPEGRQVLSQYSAVKKGLEAAFRWEVDFRPVIVLVGDRRAFQDMAGNSAYVAYAIPDRQVMVIDRTRMSERPFTLEITLKHELCHLLLHRYMGGTDIPRWLDEGVAQWISEGIPELAATPRESLLTGAALTGSLLSLESLSRSFPQDEGRLALAYEESRSVVEYITKNYGRNGVLNLLEALRKGATLEDAVEVTLLTTLPGLEKRWQKEQLGFMALLAYLSIHLYTIIFVLAGLLTFWAWVRLMLRKRRMRREPDEEEEGDLPPPEGPFPPPRKG
jgi:hypothetical protein